MESGPGDERKDDAPTSVPATSPFGITVPVPIVSDREIGIGHPGAHSAYGPGRAPDEPLLAPPPPPSKVTTPARAILAWSGLAILLIIALVSTIGALNNDVYSAGGFVRQYLSALEDGDAQAALDFPGVELSTEEAAAAGLPADAADTLLRSSVLQAPTELTQLSDTSTGDGRHTVVYSGRFDGTLKKMSFDVQRDGSWAGVFHNWRFATSPLAAIDVQVLHDASFTVNGLTLDTRAHADPDAKPSFDNSASYLVLSPGVYAFSRQSALLAAEGTTVDVTDPGTEKVSLDVEPTATFVSEVQTQIDGFLDKCATQTVLQPTGCPFGTVIDDRVLSDPAWTMVAYPPVTLTPSENAFEMPNAPGTAHVVVDVQSLYDGTKSTVDRDEAFEMGSTVTIAEDGTLNIQLH